MHYINPSPRILEELKQEGTSRRKKEGVYYTPEYITDYICRNTIIPYLSKSGVDSVYELVEEYKDNLDELEKKFKEIKILDPACGSGAFLVKAIDVLLEIHKEIQSRKENKKYSGEQLQITHEWDENKEIRAIIENNIYGVDINPESIDITKLSLFLKLASNERKLIGLSRNIKAGNSLIDDKTVDSRAFDWKKEFPEVLHEEFGGFDIVIGNPPYVRSMQTVKIKPYLQKQYCTYAGDADLYVYFFERGLSLLKDNGVFSIIVSSKFTKAKYAVNLRNHLLSFDIHSFIDFGDLPVFEDATTYPCIITIRKSVPNKKIKSYKVDSLNFTSLDSFLSDRETLVEYFQRDADGWYFEEDDVKHLLSKIQNNSRPLNTIVADDQFFRGVTTGYNEAFVITENEKRDIIKKNGKSAEIIFPYLSGKEIKRYGLEWENNYIIFVRRGLDISQYPAILDHLEKFRKQLTPKSGGGTERVGRKAGNYKWYEIQDSTEYWKIFLQEGIIFPHFNKYSNFALTSGGFFPNNKAYVIANSDRFLLGILNSKLMNFYLKSVCPFVRGEYYEYMPQYVEKFPVTESRKFEKEISHNVEKLINANKVLIETKRGFIPDLKTIFILK